jgi:hypothetical protein
MFPFSHGLVAIANVPACMSWAEAFGLLVHAPFQ